MTSPLTGDRATAFRLMTRLFIRRLIDNDLISPHADRHDSLALAYAVVLSLGVFVTFFLSIPYLAALVQLPGQAALSALSDRFLFVAASISISALAALVTWDALALEAREADILGPLPIAPRTIARAKLTAAVVFGALQTLALNAVPSVLYPAFLTLNIRGARGLTILALMASHAVTVTMAGMFGFFGILAVRSTLALLVGERAFRRASSAVQSALVVSLVTALLMALAVRANDVHLWVGGSAGTPLAVRPVLWYLGVNETLAGHLVAETPIVLAPGDRALVPTGIALAIPPGFEAQVRPRSGLAINHGITVLNSPGTIDADYRGEVQIILVNLGRTSFTVERGARIAQLVITPTMQALFRETDNLDETTRGVRGFGSTGTASGERK